MREPYVAPPEGEAQHRLEATIEHIKQSRLQAWEKQHRDADLEKLPQALSRFRDGALLPPKTRKLLEELLLEDTRRKVAQKAAKKNEPHGKGKGPRR